MSLRVFRVIPQSLAEWARWCKAQDTLSASDIDTMVTTLVIMNGSGSPEGVVAAGPGTLYRNTDGGLSATLYVKESGTSTTGWVAK